VANAEDGTLNTREICIRNLLGYYGRIYRGPLESVAPIYDINLCRLMSAVTTG